MNPRFAARTATFPQDKIAEAAARIPGGTLQVIPVGHQVHASRPDEFAATTLGFLLA
jgi:3-oxoadipate enol-lactonase